MATAATLAVVRFRQSTRGESIVQSWGDSPYPFACIRYKTLSLPMFEETLLDFLAAEVSEKLAKLEMMTPAEQVAAWIADSQPKTTAEAFAGAWDEWKKSLVECITVPEPKTMVDPKSGEVTTHDWASIKVVSEGGKVLWVHDMWDDTTP